MEGKRERRIKRERDREREKWREREKERDISTGRGEDPTYTVRLTVK